MHQTASDPLPPHGAAVPSAQTAPEPADPVAASWVVPAVLSLSLAGHAAFLAAAGWLPPGLVAVTAEPTELVFTVASPPEPRVVEAPAPEPEPLPETPPEPAVMPARQARVLPPAPEPAPPPAEPAPPAEVLTVGEGEASGWAHPGGEEGGVLGGTPGGTGTERVAAAAAPAEPAEAPTGLSRSELRRRLLAYVRGSLAGYVGRHLEYPYAARREHLEGVVMLRVRLARDGRILAVRLSRSSGHHTLDRAALASLQGLRTMPAPPHDLPWDDHQELPLPVVYELR